MGSHTCKCWQAKQMFDKMRNKKEEDMGIYPITMTTGIYLSITYLIRPQQLLVAWENSSHLLLTWEINE
jgi:hypothetical protein